MRSRDAMDAIRGVCHCHGEIPEKQFPTAERRAEHATTISVGGAGHPLGPEGRRIVRTASPNRISRRVSDSRRRRNLGQAPRVTSRLALRRHAASYDGAHLQPSSPLA
jgi:hypothetical protein